MKTSKINNTVTNSQINEVRELRNVLRATQSSNPLIAEILDATEQKLYAMRREYHAMLAARK